MMWRDYKSKVIHNKQCSLYLLTYMRLVLRELEGGMEKARKVSKGLELKGFVLLGSTGTKI